MEYPMGYPMGIPIWTIWAGPMYGPGPYGLGPGPYGPGPFPFEGKPKERVLEKNNALASTKTTAFPKKIP